MHARRRIVLAASAALMNLPTTGARVYPGRSWPLPDGHAPSLMIYCREERSASQTMRGPARALARGLVLRIEGVLSTVQDDDSLLDTIAEEVEAAIGADPTLGGACQDLVLDQTDMAVTIDEQQRRSASIVLAFLVKYRTAANAPGVAI